VPWSGFSFHPATQTRGNKEKMNLGEGVDIRMNRVPRRSVGSMVTIRNRPFFLTTLIIQQSIILDPNQETLTFSLCPLLSGSSGK
jgi:hypothetical protein